MVKLETQYCIIGSGVAGSIVAYELIEAGATSVVMLDAGKPVSMRSLSVWDRFLRSGRDPFEAHLDQAKEYENHGTTTYELSGGRLWARGGTTLCWTGHAFRLRPEDFRLRTNVGIGVDWLISYQDLEPYYGLAEMTLRVAGQGDDPGHPMRSDIFPFPAFHYSAEDLPYLQAMESLGIKYQHNCISRNAFAIDHLGRTPRCQQIGTCEYCPEGARFTADQLLDYLERQPGFMLFAETSVPKLGFGDDKKKACTAQFVHLPSGALC